MSPTTLTPKPHRGANAPLDLALSEAGIYWRPSGNSSTQISMIVL
ncbi:MAG: hypothetical protein WBF08_05840 [Candidatus Bathyarchaeia archaeon]